MKLIKQLAYISFSLVLSVGIANAETSMPTVLSDYNGKPQCESLLTQSAEQIIGRNEHKLYIDKQAPITTTPTVLGFIAYHDRYAHVSFKASVNDKACAVSVSESFVVNEPCYAVREEVFKRWEFLGNMDTNTMVLEKSKSPFPQLAYLSNAIKNEVMCLVTIRSEIDDKTDFAEEK